MADAETIQAAARVLMAAALAVIEHDPHQWSKRGCASCEAVTAILGEPFGCLKFAATGVRPGREN